MIHLAFLWHMHQPYYRDHATGETLFPWVRLHGTKDYYGMAALLRERAPLKATFNWVPCLVEQLQAFARGEVEDRSLQIARKHPDALEEDEILYMLRAFFRANREQMIYAYPRYGELFDKRGDDPARFRRTARDFSTEDLRDL